ncbi:MAG: diguanylate cyclase [Thermoanaerobaculales bacterium]
MISLNRRPIFIVGTFVVALFLGLLATQWWEEQLTTGRRIGLLIDTYEADVVVDGVREGDPAADAGFVRGDVITGIDGHVIRQIEDIFVAARKFHRGQPVDFQVLRGDSTIELTVFPGSAFPWAAFLANLFVALAYLALGLLALQHAWGDQRGRILFWFSAAVALELGLPGRIDALRQWPVIRGLILALLGGLQMGLELHLASIIPRSYDWFTRRPWLVRVYYGIGLSLSCITMVSIVADQLGWQVLPLTETTARLLQNRWGMIVWAVAVVIILVIQRRRATDTQHRYQASLVLLGVVPWALLTVVFKTTEIIGAPTPQWLLDVQPLVLLAYPVAVFVAIFRYHLLDLEFVLKRSLAFTLVTTALVVLFYALFGTGNALFARHLKEDALSLVVLSLGMLALGLAFSPLRRWIQGIVDRRFFPERLEMRQKLTTLAAKLPTLGSLPAMGQHLVEQLGKIFGVNSATLLVANPDSGLLVSLASTAVDLDARFGKPYLLEPADPGVEFLRETGHPLPASQVAGRSEAFAQSVATFEADLALALSSGETPVGVLLLGPKTNGDRFYPEELELVSLFSHTAATVFENARLFESATYESLTGLMRREAILAALEVEVQRSWRYERPLAVGMADLDHFKRVNDRHGHLVGDALLKHVANTLKHGLRTSDSIGRYGGEEFLFILPETDITSALQVAEKLRVLVNELMDPVEGVPGLGVTVSIGLAEIDHERSESCDGTALIAAADLNLLEAKRTGRNRVLPKPLMLASG